MWWRNPDMAPSHPLDPTVNVVAVRDAEKVRAVLVNYAARAAVLGPGILEFSADYPGAMRRAVESADARRAVPFCAGRVGRYQSLPRARAGQGSRVRRDGEDGPRSGRGSPARARPREAPARSRAAAASGRRSGGGAESLAAADAHPDRPGRGRNRRRSLFPGAAGRAFHRTSDHVSGAQRVRHGAAVRLVLLGRRRLGRIPADDSRGHRRRRGRRLRHDRRRRRGRDAGRSRRGATS